MASLSSSSSDYESSEDDFEPAKKPVSGSKSKGKSVEETYKKVTALEHVLLRPDTYVGSVVPNTQACWVLNADESGFCRKEITYVPALFKIFDEIIVNAADHKVEDSSLDSIKVTITQSKNEISVFNNGSGIPVVIHKEHGIYVPEMIFGHLLTSSNYDDDDKKVTGGRNGFGAKLANIFSEKFVVETSDAKSRLSFKQVYSKNMTSKTEPQVSPSTDKPFTRITFRPDLSKFHLESLDDDTVALMKKRVYDLAGVIHKSGTPVKVYLNGKRIRISSFKDYCNMYLPPDSKLIYEEVSERWQVGLAISDGQFEQVSFVNSICTQRGGTHVKHVTDKIVKHVQAAVKKSRKYKNAALKPQHIRNHMWVFVNSLIEKPKFDSQTKETLTSAVKEFGSKCNLDIGFMTKVMKGALVEAVISYFQFAEKRLLGRQGGTKKAKVTGIPKLDDANFAGGAKSRYCTLILTEGDSAKSLAVSGLSVIGRDLYGVFPLKGKPLNVRDATAANVRKNAEITNICKIVGLAPNKKYEPYADGHGGVKGLRYGKILIMADQDHDGSHIKGLLVNLFHKFWPDLLKLDGFLAQFITPIVKAFKGKKTEVFFTMAEFEAWKRAHNDGKGWKTKYYKGLGTSTSAEAKAYFGDLETHQISFCYDGSSADDAIDMAFNKKRVEDRKKWLAEYNPRKNIDYDVAEIPYKTFFNDEFIHFSASDNIRSIPSVVDGFKPSQRKVLFACLKRNLVKEIKVAQLAGYVSEHSAYHHGEASLHSTIVSMAQDFVGSNNINLLYPSGQFGTRRLGGKDAASARYIFTRLQPVTRMIFHEHDDALLDYLNEDGQSIEPKWYVPVLPMVLVNGAEGIGTGWSTSVPNYSPQEIIANLRRLVEGKEMLPMTPWYRGFVGTIESKPAAKKATTAAWKVSGIIEKKNATTVTISELQVGMWTQKYKKFLEGLMLDTSKEDKKTAAKEKKTKMSAKMKSPKKVVKKASLKIKDFKEHHTDTSVSFTVTLEEGQLAAAEKTGLLTAFKLTGSLAESNITLFDPQGVLKRYSGPLEVMQEFFDIRVQRYSDRKDHLLSVSRELLERVSNKVRFVEAVIDGEITVGRVAKAELEARLEDLEFVRLPKTAPSTTRHAKKAADDDEEEEEDDEEGATSGGKKTKKEAKSFDYLLSMQLWALTKERLDKLRKEMEDLEAEVKRLTLTEPSEMWLEDLNALEAAFEQLEGAEASVEKAVQSTHKRVANKRRKSLGLKKKRAKIISDDEDDWEPALTGEAKRNSLVLRNVAKSPLTMKKKTSNPPPAGDDMDVVDDESATASKSKRDRFDDMSSSSESEDSGFDFEDDPKPKSKPKKAPVPKKKPPPKKKAPPKRKAPAKKESESESGSEFTVETPKDMPTKRQRPRRAAAMKKAPVLDAFSISESESEKSAARDDDSDAFVPSPAKKAPLKKKSPAKKAPLKRKAPVKKAPPKTSSSSSDSDTSKMEIAKKVPAMSDDSGSSDDDESAPLKERLARKRARQFPSDSSSGGESSKVKKAPLKKRRLLSDDGDSSSLLKSAVRPTVRRAKTPAKPKVAPSSSSSSGNDFESDDVSVKKVPAKKKAPPKRAPVKPKKKTPASSGSDDFTMSESDEVDVKVPPKKAPPKKAAPAKPKKKAPPKRAPAKPKKKTPASSGSDDFTMSESDDVKKVKKTRRALSRKELSSSESEPEVSRVSQRSRRAAASHVSYKGLDAYESDADGAVLPLLVF